MLWEHIFNKRALYKIDSGGRSRETEYSGLAPYRYIHMPDAHKKSPPKSEGFVFFRIDKCYASAFTFPLAFETTSSVIAAGAGA